MTEPLREALLLLIGALDYAQLRMAETEKELVAPSEAADAKMAERLLELRARLARAQEATRKKLKEMPK